MSTINRRSMLQVAAAIAFASPLVARPASASTGLIAPPGQPMRYCRTVERELAGGAIILVKREFSVSFLRFDDGFIIEGQQVNVDAKVPHGLEQFAALEESRQETGLFPVSLDPTGLITSDEFAPPARAAVETAFREANRIIGGQRMPANDREELRQFVSTIHQAGAIVTAHMPIDLFAPAEVERIEDQTIALPTGEEGRVQSRFGGARDAATGLMRHASREVLTQIDQDRRRTREIWELYTA